MEVFSKSPLLYALAFVDHQYRQGDEVKKWGEQIVKQIKKLNPTITSCIISGDETLESLRSWLSADVDHYIYKPLRKMEVLAFLNTMFLDMRITFFLWKFLKRVLIKKSVKIR